MIEPRQRGEKTYIYDMVRWVFNEALVRRTLNEMLAKLMSRHQIPVGTVHTSIKDLPWTELGPHSSLEIRVYKTNYIIVVGCFRDGWHITITNTTPALNDWVFGDKNRSSAWTQETGRVVNIVAEIYKLVQGF